MKIEVEVDGMDAVAEALAAKVDIIMVNNLSIDLLKQVVQAVDGQAIIEVSGLDCGDKIVDIAKTGVDYISLSCLTDSFRPLGMHLTIGDIKPGDDETPPDGDGHEPR
jgi:nicotinate-nucleotide pyrophosphorylase (carboxylating)